MEEVSQWFLQQMKSACSCSWSRQLLNLISSSHRPAGRRQSSNHSSIFYLSGACSSYDTNFVRNPSGTFFEVLCSSFLFGLCMLVGASADFISTMRHAVGALQTVMEASLRDHLTRLVRQQSGYSFSSNKMFSLSRNN